MIDESPIRIDRRRFGALAAAVFALGGFAGSRRLTWAASSPVS